MSNYLNDQLKRVEKIFGKCPDPAEYLKSLSKYSEKDLTDRVDWIINNHEIGFPKVVVFHKCFESRIPVRKHHIPTVDEQFEFMRKFNIPINGKNLWDYWDDNTMATKDDLESLKAFVQAWRNTGKKPDCLPVDYIKTFGDTVEISDEVNDLFF
jgi:hypothetical protein